MKSNGKEDVNISEKLESNIKRTIKNAEEQIHEDSGSSRDRRDKQQYTIGY